MVSPCVVIVGMPWMPISISLAAGFLPAYADALGRRISPARPAAGIALVDEASAEHGLSLQCPSLRRDSGCQRRDQLMLDHPVSACAPAVRRRDEDSVRRAGLDRALDPGGDFPDAKQVFPTREDAAADIMGICSGRSGEVSDTL